MGCITDQQDAWSIPARKTIGIYREDRNLPPFLNFLNAVGKGGAYLDNRLTEVLQGGCTYHLVLALGNDIADLPVVGAIKQGYDTLIAKT